MIATHCDQKVAASETSRILEIDFQRLLASSKNMLQSRSSRQQLRLHKYVQKLQEYVDIMDETMKPYILDDNLARYRAEVNFIKELLNADKKKTADEKLSQCLSVAVPSSSSNFDECNSSENTSTELKQIRMHKVALFAEDMRKELLGHSPSLRLRTSADAVLESESGDIDALISHHNKLQEKVAEEFLQATRSLKNNITIAGHVIKADSSTVSRMEQISDKNRTDLEVEAKRLEYYAYQSCDWWVWIMLLFVIISFIAMVLFMRLFSKL